MYGCAVCSSLLRLGGAAFKILKSLVSGVTHCCAAHRDILDRPQTANRIQSALRGQGESYAGRRYVGAYSVPSAMRPIAHAKQASSLAVATLATTGRLPRSLRCFR